MTGIGGVIAFLIIGLIAGGVARLLMPGRQPMGVVATMALGMVGSVVGGAISWFFWPNEPFHPGGLVMSIIGATITLWVFIAAARSSYRSM